MDRDTSALPPEDPPEVEQFNLGQALVIAGGHFVHDSFAAFLNPLLPLLIDKFSLSLTLAGSLTLYTRLPSLLNPLIGLWADRIDLRPMVILAPAATAAAMGLIGLAPSYALMALLLLASGISSAALHVPGPVLVSQASGKQVGKGMSVWMTGGELARVVGPLFAVAAVSWLTLEGYYPVMLLGVATSAVLYYRFKEIPLRRPNAAPVPPLGQTWRAMRRLMIPLGAILVLRSFSRAALTTFLPVFVASADRGIWVGGVALATVELAGALGALAAGTLSDRVDRRAVLFVALLCAPLLLLLSLALQGDQAAVPLVLAVLALAGLASFATTPVIMAMVQEHGRDYPATANGVYMAINFLVGALAALLVGWMGDSAGLHRAFVWSALLSLLAAPLAAVLPRGR
jgi:FSR family fosmidomycin resistance protein-like MFS transporter